MPDATFTETAENRRLAGGFPVRVRLEAPEYRYTAEAILSYLVRQEIARKGPQEATNGEAVGAPPQPPLGSPEPVPRTSSHQA
ncbi:MAG: hypothetical protein ACUVRY_07850 [Thermoanaerobaculaceae bacterium]